jgi:CRP-like cAMP-binding protein
MNDLPSVKRNTAFSGQSLEMLFGGHGWLSNASSDLRSRLLAEARANEYARGERVYALGDTAGGLYGVVFGGIGLEASFRGHPVRMGHIVRAGFWFGEGPILGGTERILGTIAIEDSLVIHLPQPFLQKVMQQDEEFQMLLGRLAYLNSQMALWVACDLLIPEAPRRIAAVLLLVTGALEGLAAAHPDGFPLNQLLLGELANASRAHVNRVLGQLARAGLITKRYNHLQIIDPAGLARFAYSED